MPSNLCASSQGCLMQENLYNYWCRLYIECKCGIAVSGINFVVFFSLFFIFYQKQMFKELVVWSNFPNGQSLINCLEGISGPQP